MITEELLQLNTIQPTDRVGIMLSGGMDSALLLYMLATKLSNVIIPFTVPKTDGAEHYVIPIVEWVREKTYAHVDSPIIFGNPNLYHAQILGNALHRLLGHNLADWFYMAGNTYDRKELPGGPERIGYPNYKVISPFLDCYKTHILQAYLDYDLMELLPLTHTCTEQSVGRCNMCWQCRERQWAFKQLNLVDATTT